MSENRGDSPGKGGPVRPRDITPYCDLRIDKEGVWYHNGEKIVHRKIYLYFNRLLTKNDQEKYLIKDDNQICYLDVEDAPFVVTGLSRSSSPPTIHITLNDETKETLQPNTLRVGRDNVLYCLVKGGGFEARFSRESYSKIARYIDFDKKAGKFFLSLGKKKYYLPPPTP